MEINSHKYNENKKKENLNMLFISNIILINMVKLLLPYHRIKKNKDLLYQTKH